MLSPAQKQRFARQLLLTEIGPSGQERLCASRVRVPPGADPRAGAVARDYLERAGVSVLSGDGHANALPVPAAEAVRAIAGAPALEEAAAALCGALAAVEAIKAELGVGRAAGMPKLVLAGAKSA